jgi:serine/threonine-protein kinase SRPK3
MYELAHLAELTAVLGPPPAAFLALNPEKAAQFWDEDGMCGLDSHSTCNEIYG